MLISLPYFGPLVVNKPAQKFLCRCCSWSCAVLPQMAERGAGRRRRPEIVHALRRSPPNYRPDLPFIAEQNPPEAREEARHKLSKGAPPAWTWCNRGDGEGQKACIAPLYSFVKSHPTVRLENDRVLAFDPHCFWGLESSAPSLPLFFPFVSYFLN